MTLAAIILAAGQGTRMKSSRPKVLQRMCGRALVDHVIIAARAAGVDEVIVVVGHGRDAVRAHLLSAFGHEVRTVVQEQQRGTGHAVRCALPALAKQNEAVFLLYGDTPLVLAHDLGRLRQAKGDHPLSMLTCCVANPTGYGRILRQGGDILGVKEDRDCSASERAIDEINPGMYLAGTDFLRQATGELEPTNDQGELYLTDIVASAAKRGGVADARAEAATLMGVNDRAELAAAEELMFARIADGWRRTGVTIRSSARIDATVVIEPDAIIEHAAVLRGTTRVGAGATVEVGCVLDDTVVLAGATLLPYSVCAQSSVGEAARVGPFSHLRPDSEIGPEAHVGNFVETKKTKLDRGAKANHLAYVGDGEIGAGANVGAGTIFCNYDGVRKHKTVIGPGAFIGSDSQLVAPVTVGAGAYVATGTTVTKDVPADALAIGRTPQQNKEGYAPRLRARLGAPGKKS